MTKALLFRCTAVCVFSTALPLHGQESWQVSAGVTMGVAPQYIGSQNAEYYLLPVIDARRQLCEDTRFFVSADNGIGFERFNSHLSYGVAFGYRFGIKGDDFGLTGDDEGLEGMHDHGSTVTAVPFVKTEFNAWAFELALDKGLESNNKGLVTSLTASYSVSVAKRVIATFNVQKQWADNNFIDDYFGIGPTEVTSLRSFYDGQSGRYSSGAGVDLFLALNEKQSVIFSFNDQPTEWRCGEK